MRWLFSPDAWVLVRPAPAFRALAAQPADPGPWTAWRRPLFMAFLLGCTISLTTTGSLTLRLVVSTALSWSFVPAIEIAALALVLHGAGHWGRLPRLVDVFCMGCGPHHQPARDRADDRVLRRSMSVRLLVIGLIAAILFGFREPGPRTKDQGPGTF